MELVSQHLMTIPIANDDLLQRGENSVHSRYPRMHWPSPWLDENYVRLCSMKVIRIQL